MSTNNTSFIVLQWNKTQYCFFVEWGFIVVVCSRIMSEVLNLSVWVEGWLVTRFNNYTKKLRAKTKVGWAVKSVVQRRTAEKKEKCCVEQLIRFIFLSICIGLYFLFEICMKIRIFGERMWWHAFIRGWCILVSSGLLFWRGLGASYELVLIKKKKLSRSLKLYHKTNRVVVFSLSISM